MKKSLVALAVLAAAGAAQAQSSVTLYGLMDLWVGSTKSGLNADSVTKLDSGGFNSSRWGIQGSEDLGGGLKGVFKLEQGFRADTGVQSVSGSAFSRQSYVGLEGGFGGVYLGNAWTAMDEVIGATNPVFDSAFSPLAGMGLANTASVYNTYEDNPGNLIKYVSPSFGGFSFGATHSLDENSAAKTDQTDISVSYADGPLAVNFAYQVQRKAADDLKLTHLGASYDFGAFKLIGAYGQVKEGAPKSRDLGIGVDFPLSPALTLSAGYGTLDENAAAGDFEASSFGVAVKYQLSKRTFTYAGVRTAKEENAAGTKTDENRIFAVGIQHRF